LVIPDSSVWIPYFRLGNSPVTGVVQSLLDRDEVMVTGAVLTEVLAGAKSAREFDIISMWMSRLPYLEATKAVWVKTGSLLSGLRARGISVHLVDGLIATLAMEGKHQVYTLDTDFQRIPGVRLYKPLTQQ
jgi:predicted nucleic acid-binding protein